MNDSLKVEVSNVKEEYHQKPNVKINIENNNEKIEQKIENEQKVENERSDSPGMNQMIRSVTRVFTSAFIPKNQKLLDAMQKYNHNVRVRSLEWLLKFTEGLYK